MYSVGSFTTHNSRVNLNKGQTLACMYQERYDSHQLIVILCVCVCVCVSVATYTCSAVESLSIMDFLGTAEQLIVEVLILISHFSPETLIFAWFQRLFVQLLVLWFVRWPDITIQL